MDELKIETWYKIPTFNGYEIQFTNQQRIFTLILFICTISIMYSFG